jgi:hypothetical protein
MNREDATQENKSSDTMTTSFKKQFYGKITFPSVKPSMNVEDYVKSPG